MNVFGEILFVGIVATAILDAWQVLLKVVFGIPAANWTLVGRWLAYIPRGKLVHQAIAAAPPIRHETETGWIMHYVIGAIYAGIYLWLLGTVFGIEPTFANAIGFGVATVAAPWFLMQPGMGLGVFARKAPRPNVHRAYSLASHVVFGAGLFVGASILKQTFWSAFQNVHFGA